MTNKQKLEEDNLEKVLYKRASKVINYLELGSGNDKTEAVLSIVDIAIGMVNRLYIPKVEHKKIVNEEVRKARIEENRPEDVMSKYPEMFSEEE